MVYTLVFRTELSYSEIEDILEVKYIATKTTGYTLPPGLYEISDLILIMTSLVPNEVRVIITIDGTTIRSNSTPNKTQKFTKESFHLQL